MPKLLMIVSSARTISLADGSEHATGYWAEEVLAPYERFVSAGSDLLIAAPDRRPPQPDPWGLEPFFHYPQDDEDFMFSVFRSFAPYADEIRVTFTHLSELNLIVLRRIFVALTNTAMERRAARQLHGDGKVRTVGKVIRTALIDAFPDPSNSVTSVESDDQGNVAAQVSIGGTQAKAFGVIACTGGHYDLPHLFLFHVDSHGLIDDIAAYWDNAGWKKQLGWLEVD